MASSGKRQPVWHQFLSDFLLRNPGLKSIEDPGKLEYYRSDLNADLPPLIRDLMLKSLPDLILQPVTEAHILSVFAFAREHKIPVTVRGAGTWGYGGAVPAFGGILIDLGLMDTISVDPESLQVTLGPGARFLSIGRELERSGLTLLSMPSGKGGTFAGWISTGGMGFGTFRHGTVRKQLISLRAITPDGKVLTLAAADPEIEKFLATEGQMGIIVEATLRVGRQPSRWYPYLIPFASTADAYAFVQCLSRHTALHPDDLVVYHRALLGALKGQENSKISVPDGDCVLAVFEDAEQAGLFEAFLREQRLPKGDEESARCLWDERFLPMSIKSIGPSLLAAEVTLPIDQVAAYNATIQEWGKRLGVKFYSTSHVIGEGQALFLPLIASDYRATLFYVDLVLIPMLVRLAIQGFKGKPYGLGVWNTPFLNDLYSEKERKELVRYKKKVDPLGILNAGKFFGTQGKLGPLQKILFRPGLFNLEMATMQWLLFRVFSFLPEAKLKRRIPISAEGLGGMTHDVLSCAQCGSCVDRCPVYRATGDETITARGKLLTMKKALATKKLELAKVLPLYFCMRCGRCDEECQVHLKHRQLFEDLEKHLAASIDFPLQEVMQFIQGVEAAPELHRFLDVIRTGFDQKIQEKRQTFPRHRVTIDEEFCLHCGTCVDACMYSVRKRDEADPRRVLIDQETLCRGCGACLERCPQAALGKAATTVELHPEFLEMDDPYWTRDLIARIDLEATTGKIPVSGTGQGDPHRGSGNDGIRFGHFHIVGPAQNLLYESSADAIGVQLGRRPKYLVFEGEKLTTPPPRLIRVKTPLLIDVMPMEGGEALLGPLLEVAGRTGSRFTVRLSDYERHPALFAGQSELLILRLTAREAQELLAGTRKLRTSSGPLPGLVEIEVEGPFPGSADQWKALFPESLFCAVIRIDKDHLDAGLRLTAGLQKTLESLFASPVDIIALTSDYDPEKGYYPTTDAVPVVHHFLVDRKMRHRFSILAAGGMRTAADAQKTVQRGANGIKIDWPVLLTIDPLARQKQAKGEPLAILHDPSTLAKRIANLIQVWNVQIIEVLGASGFKDIKKTVGEENRLVIFDDLEERVYDIFKDASRVERNIRANRARAQREGSGAGWKYRELKELVRPTQRPHRFYDMNLKDSCYCIFNRDFVWPASLIAAVGRMASGDARTLLLAHAEERGNLGDGFDSIQVLFPADPDAIAEERLDEVETALQLAPDLRLRSPLMGGGMSIGSIGPGTWRARVMATRALETQMDSGEGGYPTFYLLDEKWNPLDLSDAEVDALRGFMEERKLIPVKELRDQIRFEVSEPSLRSSVSDELLSTLAKYPDEMLVQFVTVVAPDDQPYISTELKTGLFGVTKETIRRARRVVIAYSQGAKQGVGGHLLGRKVFGLVSRLRGVPAGVSLISPFPFHNCYSIEDVKAFIDALRMINRKTTISIKVSPSPDIEFIVSGLARIAKDNKMVIEVWLDGPRGGTGAAPDIIKGQMGMHMEYAIPICHEKLMDDGLRDSVVFIGSGGFRTWGDIIKGIAMGLDGVVLGTSDLVAIGCVRDRNCESGCRSGISTIEPRMQLLRDVEINAQQIINFRAILQAQMIKALAALGLKDIRELRGCYDRIAWPLLEERVQKRRRSRLIEVPATDASAVRIGEPVPATVPSPADCGVAAIVSNRFIPSGVMDLMLDCMANRGMDGVGIWKGGCYPHRLDHYAFQVLIKGVLQSRVEEEFLAGNPGMDPEAVRCGARQQILANRRLMMQEIMDRYFQGLQVDDIGGDLEEVRIPYKRSHNGSGKEMDFRCFGEKDPGDVFRFFVRVRPDALEKFVENELLPDTVWPPRQIRYRELTRENYRSDKAFMQEAEDEYIYRLARTITRENYFEVREKKAAVLSCGRNSGCWKTDGTHLPWELPEAPVNVIHRRLATGSVVDQMNAHPFAELHTALTHNGETTNYRTMLNRVTQFDLTPLAQTDTAVAALKLHVLSQYLHYPFDTLVESFSPTTGWNLTQLPPEIRDRYQRVQEVELESAPDGPYQYLCGRIDPDRRVIERLDIIDPSFLRPNVALLYDDGDSFVSIICSEKQGCDAGMEELYRLGIVRSTSPGLNFTVKTGMVSRVFYDEEGKITGHEVLDKFGKAIRIPRGEYPTAQDAPAAAIPPGDMDRNPVAAVRERLPQWGFDDFRKAIGRISEGYPVGQAVEHLTRIGDHLSGWSTGKKDRGVLSHMLREGINGVLDRLDHSPNGNGMTRVTLADAAGLERPLQADQTLVVDARGFRPEGIDPANVLSPFLDQAHNLGWRKFIVYRTQGQRGIGMGIGRGSTTDTLIDVYGSPGEYCGAFNMGARVRVHGHAQNFTGMVSHSGVLDIHGDVGKVTGFSAKGGEFNILGNVVDRGWVCAVSDPRGPGLEVNLVGTAVEHLCQALMGGSVILLGLYRQPDGTLHTLESPYGGAKILAGASAGEVIFFDPHGRLAEAQYQGSKAHPVDEKKWGEISGRLLKLEGIFGLGLRPEEDRLILDVDGERRTLLPENFKWILPTGSLEGYH
jgi:glutamate synthase domain-containing protein 2/FAD/FMN-containing dehydrogenase/ferredoxin